MMLFPSELSRRRFLQCAALALPALHAARAALPQSTDFSFLHISDTHFDPRVGNTSFDPAGRSVQELQWIADRLSRPVIHPGAASPSPSPAFCIHTGDVLEYGPIDHTWDDVATSLAPLNMPVHLMPGNHDNTWSTINPELRRQQNGVHESFNAHGVHFICLCSAGNLDPLPTYERATLTWLASDLASVEPGTPIIVAQHHPASTRSGFPSEFDLHRVFQLLAPHNVILMLDGHYHQSQLGTFRGINRVCGGTTFGKNRGYGIVSLEHNLLRVSYTYKDETRPPWMVLEKKIDRRPPSRTLASLAWAGSAAQLSGAVPDTDIYARTDADDSTAVQLRTDATGTATIAAASGLNPGRHSLRVTSGPQKDESETVPHAIEAVVEFEVPASDGLAILRRQFSAGLRAAPCGTPDAVIVADTTGNVHALSHTLEHRWDRRVGSEVVHSLAVAPFSILAGTTDGQLACLDPSTGTVRWTYDARHPILAAAAIATDGCCFGDASGFLHWLDANGSPRWTSKIGAFAFECAPLIHPTLPLVIAGNWDGYVYGVDAQSGTVQWRQWSPTCQGKTKSRYYGAADCSPALVNDSIFVCDRGYRLGSYTLDGQYKSELLTQISAIAPLPDGRGLLARSLDHRLLVLDANGSILRETPMRLGRVPARPAANPRFIAAVSDKGILNIADVTSGRLLHKVHVTPGLFVLSHQEWLSEHTLAITDMDGVLTVVRCDT